MEGNLYSVKDTKLGKFGIPFTAPNDEIAKRNLISTIRAGNNNIAEFPEDFQLFKVGTMNDDTGELKTEIKFLTNAIEYKEDKNGISNRVESKESAN